MAAEPQAEHRWLQRLAGEWQFEAECAMEPGQTPSKSAGAESVRPLGGLWVVAEGKWGEMAGCGSSAATLMTLGHDPRRGRFVGTWIDSMMAHLWVYDGALDAAGRVLTLDTEGPDPAAGGRSRNTRKSLPSRTTTTGC